MRIIVNADDFGKSWVVNDAIEAYIKDGIVTSTTIMAGGEAFEDAVERANHYPNISIGVHLHIDECKSLTNNKLFREYGMMDDNGAFIYGSFYRKLISRELKEAIYEEWNAQIKKVIDAGIYVSHLDSHHHVHILPEMYDIVCRLMDNNNIRHIRLGYVKPLKLYRGSSGKNQKQVGIKPTYDNKWIKAWISYKRRLERAIWNKRVKRLYSTTDTFSPFSLFALNLDYFMRNYHKKTIELMCHPGHPNYVHETETLSIIKNAKAELINYYQL